MCPAMLLLSSARVSSVNLILAGEDALCAPELAPPTVENWSPPRRRSTKQVARAEMTATATTAMMMMTMGLPLLAAMGSGGGSDGGGAGGVNTIGSDSTVMRSALDASSRVPRPSATWPTTAAVVKSVGTSMIAVIRTLPAVMVTFTALSGTPATWAISDVSSVALKSSTSPAAVRLSTT